MIAIGMGAQDVVVPTQESLDEWLSAEPEQIDPERQELLAALGVGGG